MKIIKHGNLILFTDAYLCFGTIIVVDSLNTITKVLKLAVPPWSIFGSMNTITSLNGILYFAHYTEHNGNDFITGMDLYST